jgi:hypothetical protein
VPVISRDGCPVAGVRRLEDHGVTGDVIARTRG